MQKILAVEDEALVRMLVVETLEGAGYAVREAADGEAALGVIKDDPEIAVIVTDIRMPKMDGFGLASSARRLKPDVRLLFMTGFSGDAVPPELTSVNILRKPFDPNDLLLAVASIFPKPI
jgi:CheY-like chemotaxis protein